jgi:NAD(P)-dependent dehydrogenase (short-subunit alcohol dehydrogenase family)
MPAVQGFVDFVPDKDLPSLKGKVIFVTGGSFPPVALFPAPANPHQGTAGLGRNSIEALAKHEPAHIYFSGRNVNASAGLIEEVKKISPTVSLTFVELDMASLASVKAAIDKNFVHDRLDILMCNAGIMAVPPSLSKDGFEIQFAVNHLGHAMVIQQLLPTLQRTADLPGADVRIVCLTTAKPDAMGDKIAYDKLRSTMEGFMGSWMRYSQSKWANVLYAAELAQRYPKILSVSVHPGVVKTDLVNTLSPVRKGFVYGTNWLMGISLMEPYQGCFSQVWTAGAARDKIVNGAFYWPIGVVKKDMLGGQPASKKAASKLWDWTQDVLAGH